MLRIFSFRRNWDCLPPFGQFVMFSLPFVLLDFYNVPYGINGLTPPGSSNTVNSNLSLDIPASQP